MNKNSFIFKISRMICTFFYLGYSRFASGTVASIAIMPLWIFLYKTLVGFDLNIYKSMQYVFFSIVVLYFLGEWTSRVYLKTLQRKDDPSEIVIDEVVGQLISYLMTTAFCCIQNFQLNKIWVLDAINSQLILQILVFIVPVILFRIFDILKPGLIGYIDKNMKNARGIMLDDVLAGFFAGISNITLIYLFMDFIL